MKMYKIFKDVSYKLLQEGENFEIRGIEYDSRKIEKDFVFVAMTGSALVAKSVDAQDLKSCGNLSRAGSSPARGTT